MRLHNYSFIIFILLLTTSLMAQPGGKRTGWDNKGPGLEQGSAIFNLPDLTEEQKSKIKDLITEQMKLMLETRNKIQEKSALLNTLETSEKPDIKAINNMIDEISVIKVKMAKAQAAHKQSIRNLLTEDQRVIFDSKRHGFGKEFGFSGQRQHDHPKGDCCKR